ncbi:unnamed protein product [Rhizophagus irregularis]|nr:unnamed protein product [Rhizophagus irregularis]
MANTLTLNCLVIPSAEPESVTRHSITTLKISTNETVDQLRPMIKERWPSLFENILPTNFILRKIDSGVVITISDQIRQYNNGQGDRGEEIFPYQLISRHFPSTLLTIKFILLYSFETSCSAENISITLLCLVKGNTTASAFFIDINKDQLVGHLKKVIKAEKQNDFAGINADRLKLWKKEIPDDQDDLLSNLILNDEPELLATREIGDYWTEKPPKRNIHVIVKPPESTATSSREQELLDQVTSLQALLNKSTYDFDVIVHSKRKPNKWTANIEHATLKGLKEYIRKMYQPPALENDGAELNLMNDGEKYFTHNDQDLREMLCIFISKNNLKFIRKFLGRSIHPNPRRLAQKYVEFYTSNHVDMFPHISTYFIQELCKFPFGVKSHWKFVEFFSEICRFHLRNMQNLSVEL